MVADMTGMSIANASLLDEGTAGAEAMLMCFSASKRLRKTFFVDKDVHPQTIACMKTRAEGKSNFILHLFLFVANISRP
jgi:glycine dehydrogenase